MILQRTIQNEVSTVGVGLHTGEKVKISLCPAPEGHGVVFQRDDIKGQPKITVNPQAVTETKLCSTVAIEKPFVPRVEQSFVSVTACGFTVIFG
jgi:UDP-3-O-[3-hydroxymyristoyl] N-acetylglucosamine deacetylase